MLTVAIGSLIVLGCMAHVLLRPHRAPAARIAWIAVILALPVVGVIAYLLLGRTSIGRERVARVREVTNALPPLDAAPGSSDQSHAPSVHDRYTSIFRVGQSISGYAPVGGNRARLMADSDAAIAEIVADIDAARAHVHLLFYIWLPDGNGLAVVEALKRARARGVVCRAMVDDLGSRDLIRSEHWRAMGEAGVKLARALEIGNPIVRMLDGRIDLRNHRKIVVIDNRVTYCGSQNCADPAFLPKAKYGPWVDAVMRFEGPVVRQNQRLFVGDWMASQDEDVRAVLLEPMAPAEPGFTAQVVASGPTTRYSAMPEMFQSLIYAARDELVVTTPYYVPNDGLQGALCTAANRGVATTLVVPARNDDFAVAAASRSYYDDLLSAGVRLFEYRPGLLHTKSLTLDGVVTMIGSANMDRRSFDLNYENNIVLHDHELTAAMRARQDTYIAASDEITLAQVRRWSWRRRLWNNALATVSPIL